MFDIGWTELLVIGIVALIVVGPKDLPGMFRALGRFTAKARSMAREFQKAMESAADESGVKDMAREFRDAASTRDMGLDDLKSMTKGPKSWARDKLAGGLAGEDKAKAGDTPGDEDKAVRPPSASGASAGGASAGGASAGGASAGGASAGGASTRSDIPAGITDEELADAEGEGAAESAPPAAADTRGPATRELAERRAAEARRAAETAAGKAAGKPDEDRG